jgi:exopolysaccharide production protein ExoZ
MCHIGSIENKYMQGVRLFPEWGMYGVDLFFVISGFVMTYVSRNMHHTLREVGRFLLKRALRVYPVYWQFTLVVLVLLWLRPEWINLASAGDPPSVIKSLLLWPQMPDPHLGVGWTLVYEMYFYLMFSAGLLLLKDKMHYGWMAWCGVLAVCVYLGFYHHTPYAEIRLITSPYGFDFLLGCAVAWAYKRGYSANAFVVISSAVVWSACAFILGAGVYGTVLYYNEVMMRVLAIGVPSALFIFGGLMLERRSSIYFPEWLCKVGDASYSLYLLHTLLLSAMGKLWQHLHIETMVGHVAYVCLMAGFAVLLARLNYRFFEHPLSRWYHRRLAA